MSEREEVVVTYADSSETSDNEAIGDLLDEHTIAEREKSILICYRFFISPHNRFSG